MPTLNWIGKEKVLNHHQDVPYRILEKQYTYNAEDSDNLIIHGDNLAALKSLLPQYEGRVKCIYIDPPYNTGNEGWVYNDKVNDPKILKWLDSVVGKEGEDLSRHDKWLCMMYPRLRMLHKLLAPDGVIFISIDDNEQANLKLVMDEIFGGGNFVANILWKKKTNGNNMGHIPPVHDFIVCYAKNQQSVHFPGFPFAQEFIDSNYKNPDDDPRGPWTTTDLSANHKGPHFKIINPNTGEEHYPPRGRYWVFNEAEVLKRIGEGRIIFGKRGTTKPVQKVFLYEKSQNRKAETWWDNVALNSDGTEEIAEILEPKAFDHSKPSKLIRAILQFSTVKDAIILDSFAGSGTTAHAVLNLNKADGGNRKFILVEMEDYAERITAERVRRVVDGYADKEGTGGSFTYCTIGEPLFLPNGFLNEAVGPEKIREYVWYSETAVPYTPSLWGRVGEGPYYLGSKDGAGYYFYYEPDSLTTLDHEFLGNITQPAATYVIYADNCLLPKAFMQKHGIIFKKIPRDIARF